ncbi:hypothetical protein [Hoeflea sp.]|uniref:hypothetical protein n=1 Tax=Hoeflea sp. TaxID=1940281 RepID=UPI00199E3D97|nr:hypothetical protein [Hoeflea sp.]MBC7279982.1 hypothetical protein [Hoeflea sp.]
MTTTPASAASQTMQHGVGMVLALEPGFGHQVDAIKHLRAQALLAFADRSEIGNGLVGDVPPPPGVAAKTALLARMIPFP